MQELEDKIHICVYVQTYRDHTSANLLCLTCTKCMGTHVYTMVFALVCMQIGAVALLLEQVLYNKIKAAFP